MEAIQVRFVAQLKQAAGRATDEVPAAAGLTLFETLAIVAERHGPQLREFLLTARGEPRPSLVIALGDQQVPRGANPSLRAGDVVTLIAPMSGG